MNLSILHILTKPTNKVGTMLIISFAVLFFGKDVMAQVPFTQRQVWDGPYDIKMIAAPNLEAVYLNRAEAESSRLRADSVIKYSTMLMSGTLLDINNRYKGGSPFVEVTQLALPSVLCPDPNLPCMAGQSLDNPSSSCPVKYNNPPYVPATYVSMTYADYDNDVTTYSSSMAQLDISSCSEIESAYLYWTGMFRGSNPAITLVDGPLNSFNGTNASTVFNTAAGSGYQTIKFKIPGGAYQNITGTNITTTSTRYLCVADVTATLQGTGGGQFWVGNLQSYPNESDGGSSSGWVLVVVFRSPLSPPRRICLWDGLECVNGESPTTACPASKTITLTGLQAPSTANFKSYVGFAALDGENIAAEGVTSAEAEGLGFQTNAGGTYVEINPFITDQPPYRLWTKKGFPAQSNGTTDNVDACKTPLFNGNWGLTYDGISSMRITSYNEANDKNGNEIVRLPSNPRTLGLDAHHMKLPSNAIAPNATQATLTVQAGPQGGTSPFMAYIAIERLQPKLVMSKYANSPTTTPGSTISYTLRIRNLGNTPSLGATIYDTLDIATTYTGPLSSIRYVNGVASGTAGVTLAASSSGRLQFKLTTAINAKDSIDVTFTVSVQPLSNTNLWNVQCKRTILNDAWVRYKISSAAGNTDSLTGKSNGNDCGIGTETRVLVTGFSTPPTVIGPFNACTYSNKTVLEAINTILDAQSGIDPSMLDEFDIRDNNNIRIQTADSVKYLTAADLPIKAYRDLISGGTCQQLYHINFAGCGLPVEMITFEGWKDENANVLTWSTSSEKNNKQFIIERSSDGVNFSTIGTVSGKGNSSATQTYYFQDEKPLGNFSYYRLKQEDHDGTISYSYVISILNEQTDIHIYPNPNNGSFTINLLSPQNVYTLDITDISGRSVYMNAGEIAPSSIEINDLAKGVYIVRFFIDNETIIKKMVVY